MLDTVCRCSKLPLPLEEGWGEGIAMAPTHLFSSYPSGPKTQGEFSFFGYSLGPHPGPLPKGEGDYRQILDTL